MSAQGGTFYRKEGVSRNDTLRRGDITSWPNLGNESIDQNEVSQIRELLTNMGNRLETLERNTNGRQERRWVQGNDRGPQRFGRWTNEGRVYTSRNLGTRRNEAANIAGVGTRGDRYTQQGSGLQNNWDAGRAQRNQWVSTSNQEFSSMVKAAYRHCQIRHHEGTWQEVPNKIKNVVGNVFDTITPPYPDAALQDEFRRLREKLEEDIKSVVQNHLQRSKEQVERELSMTNPDDKEAALNIVYRQLSRNLKRKITHDNKCIYLEEAEKLIGRTQIRNEPEQSIQEGQTVGANEGLANTDETSEVAMEASEATRKRNRTKSTPEKTVQVQSRNSVEGSPAQATPVKKNRIENNSDSNQGAAEANKFVHQREIKSQWEIKLKESTNTIVIGDSNLSLARKIPSDFEVHAFPGMHLQHATSVINKLPRGRERPLRVILSVGINHRDWSKEDLEPEINALREVVDKAEAEIYLAGVPLHGSLNNSQKEILTTLNNNMKDWQRGHYINPILTSDVDIIPSDRYRIHHTQETTDRVMQSFIDFLV